MVVSAPRKNVVGVGLYTPRSEHRYSLLVRTRERQIVGWPAGGGNRSVRFRRKFLEVARAHSAKDRKNRGEERYRDEQSQESEQRRHQRLNAERQRRRQVDAALHENGHQQVILQELDDEVADTHHQRLVR